MSVNIETLEQLKLKLKQQMDVGMPIKSDLYSHLNEVFNRICLHHPDDAYDKFEEISALVKQTNFKIQDPKQDWDFNAMIKGYGKDEQFALIQRMRCLLNEEPE